MSLGKRLRRRAAWLPLGVVIVAVVLTVPAQAQDDYPQTPRAAARAAAEQYVAPIIGSPGERVRIRTRRCENRAGAWKSCRARVTAPQMVCRVVFAVREHPNTWTVFARELRCASA